MDMNSGDQTTSTRRRRSAKPPKSLQAAEFFAGIGLVRIALEQCGGKVVFANDIDPAKAEMYDANFPSDQHLVVGDIHDLAANDIPACDLYTASFPCNDLSIAGKWEGLNGKESSAFWGLIRLLRDAGDRRPPFVMIENVVGFLMSREGDDLRIALEALNELGYAVDVIILNAIHWTPQSRARLFIIGRLTKDQADQSIAFASDARPKKLADFVNGNPQIQWDLRPLPPLPASRTAIADIVEDLPDSDALWWNEERTAYFMNQLSDRHAAQAAEMIGRNSWSYATAFRRVRQGRSMAELRTDGIAGCLRTPRGGSGRQILFQAGFGQRKVRLLSARECARLQGVPDSYRIDVPLNQALFGFGDAVCVPAVAWLVRNAIMPCVTTAASTMAAAE